MKPGATTLPVASMVVVPVSGSRLIEAMRSPTMPTSATWSNPESGSITRPPLMTVSKTWVAGRGLGAGEGRRGRPCGLGDLHRRRGRG